MCDAALTVAASVCRAAASKRHENSLRVVIFVSPFLSARATEN
jgi:hypothetical protein